jgi:hypothetical protein
LRETLLFTPLKNDLKMTKNDKKHQNPKNAKKPEN